ncbi:MAG: SCO family protein [Polyangiaceae bacterium]|nr:SCO family protein [Polyangiaceae bacterium]
MSSLDAVLRLARSAVITAATIGALSLIGCAKDNQAEALATLGEVPRFALKDQEGRAVTAASLRGSPLVVAFMFTRCPTICPRITASMRGLQSSAKSAKLPLKLLSISVDPETDTPEVLKSYALKHGVDLANWLFLSGDMESTKATVIEGFKIALERRPNADVDPAGIIHGSHLVLVDAELKIRGYYRSEEPAALKKLLNDAKLLLAK